MKQLSDLLDSLEANSKTAGRKRKRPLFSAVFAFISKRWKQLIDEEKAEKEYQKLLKKKGKQKPKKEEQKQRAKGKDKQRKACEDVEKEADEDRNCHTSNSSFIN